MYRRSSSRNSSRTSSRMSKESSTSPGNSLTLSVHSSKDLSQDQVEPSITPGPVSVPVPVLPVPAAAAATTTTGPPSAYGERRKLGDLPSYMETSIDLLRRRTLAASTTDAKRSAIHEWMSQNFMVGPSSKSISVSVSGEGQLSDDLDNNCDVKFEGQGHSKGPDDQLLADGLQKQSNDLDLDQFHEGQNVVIRTQNQSQDAKSPFKMETLGPNLQGFVAKRPRSPAATIVCECSKYSLCDKHKFVAKGINPSELCKDVSCSSAQYLSVEFLYAVQSISPQSSPDENYTGFGLSKGSRRDLLDEIVTFSNLNPTGGTGGPENAQRHKNDSGFASTATTATSPPCVVLGGTAATPPSAGLGGIGYPQQQHRFHFNHIDTETITPPEPPASRVLSKPPDLRIDPIPPPESGSSCSPEIAKLTSGLEWPNLPLCLLSPLLPEPAAKPASPLEWNATEHFREDYFSFTGLVDMKSSSPPHQSLLNRFLDEAAGITRPLSPLGCFDPDDDDVIRNQYADDNAIFRFPKIPNAGRCSAFGPGLELGQVLAKNNFQVCLTGQKCVINLHQLEVELLG